MDPDDSAEVVLDFKDALQELQSNHKPAIDVLTVIAKENTNHAEAISDVLEEHIKTVSVLISMCDIMTDCVFRHAQNGGFRLYMFWTLLFDTLVHHIRPTWQGIYMIPSWKCIVT
jgi:hypothetical protein